jgi:hypothetical protein
MPANSALRKRSISDISEQGNGIPDNRSLSGNTNEDRYSGHDSIGNKRALIQVSRYRKEDPSILPSIPEETALNNYTLKKPLSGKANITEEMSSGTAICHKVSDKSIRIKINGLLKLDNHVLVSYLEQGLEYIKPDHEKDNTPSKGEYHDEAQRKYNAATGALEKLRQPSLSATQKSNLAHEVGKNIANSPVNLFIGDSRQNSTNQAYFDPNRYYFADLTKPMDIDTPRSARGKQYSLKNSPEFHSSQSTSSFFPKTLREKLLSLAYGNNSSDLKSISENSLTVDARILAPDKKARTENTSALSEFIER